jgi:hypothetical protein
MKIKIRPDAARVLQNNDWHQMNDWLAGLRDDGAAGPPGYGYPEPLGNSRSQPDGHGTASARLPGSCRLAGTLIAGQRLCSRGMVLAAARAWRGYGGRRHPARPVSTARAR